MKLTTFLFLLMVQVIFSGNSLAEDKYDLLRKGEAPNVDSVLVPEYAEKVPHVGLEAISKLYEGSDFPAGKVEERTRFLKAFFLTYSNQYARASINALKAQNVSSTFLADIDDVRKWYVDLMGQPPEKIEEKAEAETDRLLSVMMAKKGERKEQCLAEMEERYFNAEQASGQAKIELSAKIMFHYAQRGEHAAIQEMVRAYASNSILPANPAKRYFWLKHAEWIGADVKAAIEQAMLDLDQATITKMDLLFSANKYPDAMEKPEGRWQVIGGPNRRWVPPYLGKE